VAQEASSAAAATAFLDQLTANLNPTRNPERLGRINWADPGPSTAFLVVKRALAVYRQGRISQAQAWRSVRRALRPFPELDDALHACVHTISNRLSEVRLTLALRLWPCALLQGADAHCERRLDRLCLSAHAARPLPPAGALIEVSSAAQ
jgi:hypothetical protein